MRPGTNIVFTYASNRVYINAGGVITNTVVASNAIWAYFAGTATNWLGSNALWLILQTNSFATNAQSAVYAGTATNWLGSNSLWVLLSTNLPPLCAGSNVWFTTNAGCFTINASNTGGGIAGSIYFTNVYGVAPGTNVTFSTNAGIVYINAVSNAAPGTNITSNLLAWWRFDEGAGTNTTDWTGNGNTGWLTNFSGGPANNPTWVPGKIGSYAIFMRTNLLQCVIVPTIVTQRIAGSVTWWQWQTNVFNCSFTRGVWGTYPGASPPEWDCQVYGCGGCGIDNTWYIGAGNSPETRLVIPADANNWPTNDWIHYAFTWGTNGQAFYANGVLLTNNALNSGSNNPHGTDPFRIGALGVNGAYFSGAFDDFRIYTTNLTSAEIANLYQYYIDHMGDTNFVMKSGDTMTGPLVIESELTVNNNNVIITNGLILFYNGTYWCGWGVDAFGLYPGCNVSFGTSWLDGNGGIYFGRGFGWTNLIDDVGRMISGGPAGGFYGNGLGLTNIDLSAITNAWWLTNGYPWTNLVINASNIFWENREYDLNHANLTNLDEVDSGLFLATGAGFLGNGQYLTNIYATNLAPSSGVAVLDSNNWFTMTNVFTNTLFVSTNLEVYPNSTLSKMIVRAGNNNTLIVSNGSVGIARAPGGFTLDVNGSARINASIVINGGISGTVGMIGMSDGLLRLADNNGLATAAGIMFGQAGNGGSTYILSTNWPALMVAGYSNNPAFRIQAGTNSSGSVKTADLYITGSEYVSKTVTATNGMVQMVKPSFTTNFTCTTNLQTYCCSGTNQVITLPTNVLNVIYRFASTNGWGSFIISNPIAGGTIRDGTSGTFTQIGIGSPSFFTPDGTNWWPAARTKVVFPTAQFSCTTNIPLTVANTAYPVTFNSSDFNNSQGVALLAGTNGLASKIVITNAGQYEFDPSVVISFGGNNVVRYWFRSNNTNVPNSCTPVKGQNNTIRVVTVPFLVNVTQRTEYEIWAESDSTTESLLFQAASGNYPLAPSVICPVKRISDPWP